MERTPSPPRRVHTPPAPLHGAKHDSYEPFSPRRSSRVAAQQHLHHGETTPTRRRTTRDVTPTSSRKKATARASIHTLSPPSSPVSPAKHFSPRSTRRSHHDTGAVDSDSDHAAPTPARRFLSTMAPHGMLPTPAKTPRKRALQSEESLGSTARVLFPNRPATVDEAMPSPRKARKTKTTFALHSFADEMDEAGEKIEIYTDSKERVPTHDDEEDNPFISKKGKGKAKAAPQKPRKVDAKSAKMFEAANHDEGMVYLFRGKKIFRKFHDVPPSNGSEEDPHSSGDDLRHQAGPVAHRPLTRSAIKPRLLFQEEIQARQREHDHEDDEEAVTDIEVPITNPRRKAYKVSEAVTSVTQETTPPPPKQVKRQISFDSWSRVKSSARTSSSSRDSKKRSGAPMESATDKKARSEHSSSSMSVDDF